MGGEKDTCCISTNSGTVYPDRDQSVLRFKHDGSGSIGHPAKSAERSLDLLEENSSGVMPQPKHRESQHHVVLSRVTSLWRSASGNDLGCPSAWWIPSTSTTTFHSSQHERRDLVVSAPSPASSFDLSRRLREGVRPAALAREVELGKARERHPRGNVTDDGRSRTSAPGKPLDLQERLPDTVGRSHRLLDGPWSAAAPPVSRFFAHNAPRTAAASDRGTWRHRRGDQVLDPPPACLGVRRRPGLAERTLAPRRTDARWRSMSNPVSPAAINDEAPSSLPPGPAGQHG